VNLHGRGPQSTQALADLRPARLWAYGCPGAPPWLEDEHEVTRWCRLVAGYGCEPDPQDLVLDAGGRHAGPVVVHPGAAGADRRWPPARFAAVARGLAGAGSQVRVTAGPGEDWLAAEVVTRAGLPTTAMVAGLDLAELADLVHASRLVICGDTGVAHLATAYRTPSIVLFGPNPPARWGPPPRPYHRVLWHPADHGATPALLRIQPEEVLAAAADLLTGADPGRPSTMVTGDDRRR
jgi:ADP-heptose:LPS heptosyltransferase